MEVYFWTLLCYIMFQLNWYQYLEEVDVSDQVLRQRLPIMLDNSDIHVRSGTASVNRYLESITFSKSAASCSITTQLYIRTNKANINWIVSLYFSRVEKSRLISDKGDLSIMTSLCNSKHKIIGKLHDKQLTQSIGY